MRTPLALAAALALAACNNTPAANQSAAADNMAMGPAETPMGGAIASASGAAATPDFVTRAAISDMFEIESSRVAIQRSNNAEIKKFANQMVTDHTATTAKLKSLVASNNLAAPPNALDEPHQKMLADLKSAAADDFDETYLDQQDQAHTATLDLLNGYAAGGENADLKAMAAETAPKVQQHLAMVKQMDDADVDDQAEAKGAGAR